MVIFLHINFGHDSLAHKKCNIDRPPQSKCYVAAVRNGQVNGVEIGFRWVFIEFNIFY